MRDFNKIFIAGYYGLNNIGDECILAGMTSSIRAAKEGCDFLVLTSDAEGTEKLHGVTPVLQDITAPPVSLATNYLLRGHFLNLSRALNQSDLFILGGGSLLQDLRPHYMPSLMGLLKLAQIKGKKTAIYGVGAGPIDTRLGRVLARQVLNKVDVVTVRDRMSLEVLEDCGVKDVVMTCDPAFGMRIPPEDDLREFDTSTLFDDGEGLLCNTCYRWLHDSDVHRNARDADDLHSQKLRRLADIYSQVLERHTDNCIFLPTVLSDVKEYRRLSEMIGPRTKVVDYRNDFGYIMGALRASRLLMGMRLHSLILATILGVPFVPISYCGKVKSYLELVGMSELYMDVEDLMKDDFADRFLTNFEMVSSKSNIYTERLTEANARMKKIAAYNAELVVELLG